MRSNIVRRLFVVALVILSSACSNGNPTGPSLQTVTVIGLVYIRPVAEMKDDLYRDRFPLFNVEIGEGTVHQRTFECKDFAWDAVAERGVCPSVPEVPVGVTLKIWAVDSAMGTDGVAGSSTIGHDIFSGEGVRLTPRRFDVREYAFGTVGSDGKVK